MTPTPYPDVNSLIETLLAGLRAALGKKLVGLYLFGSLVTAAFDQGISDVDLIAAVSADLDEDEFWRLKRMHADVALGYQRWADRIEVGYLSVETLREFDSHRKMARISPGEPFHMTEVGTSWLFNLSVLREQGLTLFGPPPPTLIPPIAAHDLVRVLPELMQEWREWIEHTELIHQRTYQAHMIITMCRSLYTSKQGGVASKKRAASWAEQELPQWSSLIRDALSWREAGDDGHIVHDATLPETLRFVHSVIDSILNEQRCDRSDPVHNRDARPHHACPLPSDDPRLPKLSPDGLI